MSSHDQITCVQFHTFDVLLDESAHNSVLPLLGGDFSACFGTCESGDDSAVLGTWGFVANCLRYGCWNMGCAYSAGWTPACRWRIAGLANVLIFFLKQLDFILVRFEFIHGKYWHHNCLNAGLDHRCAHSMFKNLGGKTNVSKTNVWP